MYTDFPRTAEGPKFKMAVTASLFTPLPHRYVRQYGSRHNVSLYAVKVCPTSTATHAVPQQDMPVQAFQPKRTK